MKPPANRFADLKGKLAKKPGMKAAGALSAYVSAKKGKK